MGMFDGTLAAGLTGWINPTDPSQTVQPTPADVQRQQAYAQALMQQGSDYSPVRSKWQGLARLADGLVGGWQAGQADKAQAAGQAASRAHSDALVNALMGGGGAPVSTPDATAAPAPGALGAAPAAAPASGGLPSMAAMQGSPTGIGPNNLFSGVEQRYKLPPGYLAGTMSIEDPSGDPNATSPTGAKGPFQFTKGTAAQYGLSNPSDMVASADAAGRLAADNAASLTKALGRPPTSGELYLAHQQGAGAAAALLANPDAPAGQVLAGIGASPRNITVNGGNPNAPASAFTQKWTSRFGGGGNVGGGSISGLPTMAGPGMATLPPTQQAFGPLGTGQPSAQPAALALAASPQQSAPAQQAITAATGGGDPLVTVPGYAGQWNKAKIEAAPDGTDVPDDGELAKAQGGAPAAPSPAASVVTAGNVPGAPAVPAQAATAPQAAPSRLPAGITAKMLTDVLNDPYASPTAQALATSVLTKAVTPVQKYSDEYKDAYGNVVIKGADGDIKVLNSAADKSAVTDTPDIRNYNFYKTQATAAGQTPVPFQDWEAAHTKGGGSRNHVIGPGGALVGDDGKPLFTNAGTEGSLDAQTTDFLADRVVHGDTTALVGLGRGAQGASNIAKVQKRAGEMARENMGGTDDAPTPGKEVIRNQADRSGEMAGARASGTLNARLDTYAKEASGAMDLAIEQSRQLPRSTWTPLNRAIQMVQSGASDPRLASFVAGNNAVINTYAKAINPNGVPTVSDKAHASEVLSTAQSPEAYEATIRQLQREINIAHNAARGARAAERSGTAAQDMAVTPDTGAPGTTSRGFWDSVLHPFGGGAPVPQTGVGKVLRFNPETGKLE